MGTKIAGVFIKKKNFGSRAHDKIVIIKITICLLFSYQKGFGRVKDLCGSQGLSCLQRVYYQYTHTSSKAFK